MVAISVILPVFNRRAILGRAIDSVLAQDFTDWELIVVDDGSTDGSADVAAAYADHRIRVIRQPGNLGGNAARNRGIEASTAPLVAFLDSDDRFLPHKLRFDVESFAARPDLEVLLTSFLYDKDAPVRKIKSTSPNPPIDDNGQFVEALYLHRLRKATPGITARRQALERVGGFDEGLRRRQDFDLLLRLAKVARCVASDVVTWVKVQTPEAISADRANFMKALVPFFERHPEYYDVPAYRRGFAIDVGRHFSWNLVRGRVGTLGRDLSSLRHTLGTVRLARLLVETIVEYPLHRRRRKRERRNSRA